MVITLNLSVRDGGLVEFRYQSHYFHSFIQQVCEVDYSQRTITDPKHLIFCDAKSYRKKIKCFAYVIVLCGESTFELTNVSNQAIHALCFTEEIYFILFKVYDDFFVYVIVILGEKRKNFKEEAQTPLVEEAERSVCSDYRLSKELNNFGRRYLVSIN